MVHINHSKVLDTSRLDTVFFVCVYVQKIITVPS